MHINFEDVQAVDDKFICQTSRKCCGKDKQREITHRQYEVELWFFHTALCISGVLIISKYQLAARLNLQIAIID